MNNSTFNQISMKKYLVLFIFLNISSGLFAQSYSKYMNQGKSFYNKSQFLTALERFDLAYEFAKTDTEKNNSKNWKNKSRKKIRKQQDDLRIALAKAKEEKKKSDSLLTVAKEMQLKVETAMFDKAVKEHFDDWKGYVNYDWTNEYDDDTKKGLEILNKIDSLDLSNNALLRLPKEVAECPNLKYINLLGNYDIDWQDCFTKVKATGINSVYVSVNDLSDIDSTYWHLISGIEILKNRLQKIPENILQQKQLTYLNLSGKYSYPDTTSNNFSSLPPKLFELTNLKYLNLTNCQLSCLPPEIGNLTNLTELYLHKNQLSSQPPEIGSLTNLTKLWLSNNKLSSQPPEIGNLINLTELYLHENQLSSLPSEIGNLTNLTKLWLSNNKLSSLPPEMFNLEKNSVSNWFEVGQQLFDAKNYKQALKCYLKSIEKDNIKYKKYAFGNAGLCYRLLGNNEKALEYLNKRLAFDENNVWALNQLSYTYYAMKEYTKAYNNAKKLANIDSDNYSPYFNLSWYALFVEKPQEAIEAAKKSLELAPEKTGVYTNLALGYVLNKQYELAKPIYLEWKDKKYDNERTWKEVFLQDIADLEAAGIKHKDFKKVRELLE